MTTVHTIRKFALELQLENTTDHYRFQRKAISLIKEKLTGKMDNLLTEIFPGNEVTRIKKLEINLGNINAGEFEEVFIEACARGLAARLKELSGQSGSLAGIKVARNEAEIGILEQFLYFLQNGNLPWSALHPAFDAWKDQVLNAVRTKTEFFILQYTALTKRQAEVTDRLILQFDDPFLQHLVYACEPSIKNEVNELFVHLQKAAGSIRAVHLRKQVLLILFELLFKSANKLAEQVSILNQWFNKLFIQDAHYRFDTSAIKELEQILKKTRLSLPADEEPELQNDQTFLVQKKESDETEIEKKDPIGTEDAVFIGNAGLVILHPYLPKLFEATALMKDNCFLEDEARHRGVHLLEYMASGGEALPEYILPLNKLLCGVAEGEHIDRFIQLTDEEKKEAENLLHAVISNWASLGNTSVEGLQQAFLQRRGKLNFNAADQYWKLNVERSGIDILLDKLPWGYSYIQLPWMKHRLITEW